MYFPQRVLQPNLCPKMRQIWENGIFANILYKKWCFGKGKIYA